MRLSSYVIWIMVDNEHANCHTHSRLDTRLQNRSRFISIRDERGETQKGRVGCGSLL